MGYCGFGLQSWIYRMRPRKPFFMERKDSFTKVPIYHRNFKIQSSQSSQLKVFLSSVLIFCFLGLGLLLKPKLLNHSREIKKETVERIIIEDNLAFNFLINSGKNRLSTNNIIGAYSEFSLAYKIKPENAELKHVLIDTTFKALSDNPKAYNPGLVDTAVKEATVAQITRWMKILGSANTGGK